MLQRGEKLGIQNELVDDSGHGEDGEEHGDRHRARVVKGVIGLEVHGGDHAYVQRAETFVDASHCDLP